MLTRYYSGDTVEKNEMGGRGEACTGFWCGNPSEKAHLGDSDVDGRIILRWILRKWDVGVWTGSSWLRIATGGGPLRLR
jgi:hypothetical protein